MPDFPLTELIERYPRTMVGIFGSIVLLVLVLVLVAWLVFGRGPRRRRGMRAARKLLKAGSWKAALEQLKRVCAIGTLSGSWRKRIDRFEAECLQAGAQAALKDKQFEDALHYGMRAAGTLDQP